MALKVRVKNIKTPTNNPMSAIAVVGRFIKGANGWSAFKTTPSNTPIMNVGQREIVFNRSFMVFEPTVIAWIPELILA